MRGLTTPRGQASHFCVHGPLTDGTHHASSARVPGSRVYVWLSGGAFAYENWRVANAGVASGDGFAARRELRERVCAMVDEFKPGGWPPERVLVVKQVADDVGLRPCRCPMRRRLRHTNAPRARCIGRSSRPTHTKTSRVFGSTDATSRRSATDTRFRPLALHVARFSRS
jgi:hypothetical protein